MREMGFPPASFHGDVPPAVRQHTWRAFLRGDSHVRVLVCTDIASRGLDTTGVDQVMMFDAPMDAGNFLHRVGRTGRMGRRGRLTVFTEGRRERAAMKTVENARLTSPDLKRSIARAA